MVTQNRCNDLERDSSSDIPRDMVFFCPLVNLSHAFSFPQYDILLERLNALCHIEKCSPLPTHHSDDALSSSDNAHTRPPPNLSSPTWPYKWMSIMEKRSALYVSEIPAFIVFSFPF